MPKIGQAYVFMYKNIRPLPPLPYNYNSRFSVQMVLLPTSFISSGFSTKRFMRWTRKFSQEVGYRSSSVNVFQSSTYSKWVQWHISRKQCLFQGSKGGPTFSRSGGIFFQKEGGPIAYIPLETHITWDFPGGPDPPPPSGTRMCFQVLSKEMPANSEYNWLTIDHVIICKTRAGGQTWNSGPCEQQSRRSTCMRIRDACLISGFRLFAYWKVWYTNVRRVFGS